MNNSVFMSIKEIHMNRILMRVKNHEFRTQIPKNSVNYIIVYVPSPVKKLKYVLKVGNPICTPEKINKDGWGNEVFNQCEKKKYAFPIESVYELKAEIDLHKLKTIYGFTAPQSFAYGEKYELLLKQIEKIGLKKLY